MQARYYDPVMGRFLAIDPVGYSGGVDTGMFNRYAYTLNNPINLTDPDGRCAGPAIIPCAFVALEKALYATTAILVAAAVGEQIGQASDEANDDATEDAEDSELPAGEDLEFGDKIKGQLGERGWTEDGVRELVDEGEPTGTSTDNTDGKNDPATVYGSKDGGHVVVNDKTGEVVQVSDKTDDNWVPDDRIKWKEE